MQEAGTSRVTIDPVPITAPRPIVTPGRTATFSPSHTSSSILTGAQLSSYKKTMVDIVTCPLYKTDPKSSGRKEGTSSTTPPFMFNLASLLQHLVSGGPRSPEISGTAAA
jgi:hypothetical protein